ncbi:hypothetical protein TNIN_436361 [Trichonephila inaurata madagascariensis]|uniref:Uncharacterized protein n=1 Tax=Trichonephila inaurata madagascariensis TaxID=2747483 RepID=A0A8X6I681_9ARAC|nr:hypothetical protein TNIN_436361 [Trichonephila inaurata madagascariensis]
MESAIIAKQLLPKATNSVIFNFEECSTLLIQIEACLNSHSHRALSRSVRLQRIDSSPLLKLRSYSSSFPRTISALKVCVALSERWNLIQRLRRYFWDQGSTEYLHRLQPSPSRRTKTKS